MTPEEARTVELPILRVDRRILELASMVIEQSRIADQLTETDLAKRPVIALPTRSSLIKLTTYIQVASTAPQ